MSSSGALPGPIRRWIGSGALDAVADNLFLVSLGWAAAAAATPAGAGAILAAGTIPRAGLMLVGGHFADRWGLLLTARLTLTIRAVLMAGYGLILAIEGPWVPWLLGLVSLLAGLADAVHTPAMAGMLQRLTRDGRVMESSESVLMSLTLGLQLVSAPAAGWLVARGDGSVGYLAAAVLLAAAGLLLRLQLTSAPAAEPADEHRGLLGPARYALEHPDLLRVLVTFTTVNLAGTAPLAVGIPLLAEMQHWPGWSYGLAALGFPLGASVSLLVLARVGARVTLPAGALVMVGSLGLVAIAFAKHPLPAGLGALWLGAWLAPASVRLKTLVRMAVPAHMAGQIQGLQAFAIHSGIPLGFGIFGLVSGAWGPGPATLVMCGLLLCSAPFVSSGRQIDAHEPLELRGDDFGVEPEPGINVERE